MPSSPVTLRIGFDLDLTLLNTLPGIATTLVHATREVGVVVNVERVLAELGPPLSDVLAAQLPRADADRVTVAYRRLYQIIGPRNARLMPGAREALEAVSRAGAQAYVITGQQEDSARSHIRTSGLAVAAVIGGVVGPQKADVLRRRGIHAYVGDQRADMAAARSAGCVGVAVAARYANDLLRDADVVLESLAHFPAWFETWRSRLTATRG